ncbi:class I fructose-bisphosphate aldolase [Pseudonocardia nigra]|uniref:class I fructose-bisphosphate aldolase n=1 Tax=Pseudonocardia nigra TaxID=1921578 RepID=UPI001C5D56B3|nr:hypothetical protein [Pseudonocardia nigra]
MEASQMRLGRLFDPTSGRAMVAAFDRGLGASAAGGGEDALGVVESLVDAGVDGLVISPGMLDRTRHLLAHRGAPAALVRSDFFFMGSLQPPGIAGPAEEYRCLITAGEAVAMGADAMVLFLILGNADDAITADNAAAVARTTRAAHAVGLPVIVEAVLWGSRSVDQSDAQALAYVSRLAAELGADAVKTQYTGDITSMRTVVDSCPVPVLLLGGPKSDDQDELLRSSAEALSTGARGLVYGRNVWQTDDPRASARRLHDIVHGLAATPVGA